MNNLTVYCRSCNREITVSSELPESYIEVKEDGTRQTHAKADCDNF